MRPLLRSAFAIALTTLALPVLAADYSFTDEERAWWAIQPVNDPAPPMGGDAEHAIDAFINSRLEQDGLEPAPPASSTELVRRIYFDLHGLPPTPEQVAEFESAFAVDQEGAIRSLVDELLDSPRYGERWAQHWLDVVRYAESDGYREDAFRPGAHRYRDYVIRSFNEDKPYGQFIREQLAADEFAADDPAIVEATGFLRLGVYEWNQRDAEGQRDIMINEITNLTGETFLGIGIGCARCHDHKFDPLLQRDYFALQAFLSSTAWPTDHKLGSPEAIRKHKAYEAEAAPIREEMHGLLAEARAKAANASVIMFPEEVQAMVRKPRAERSSYEEQISMLVQRQVDREVAKIDPEKVLAKDEAKLARYRELEKQLAELESSDPGLADAFISTDTGTRPAVTYMGSGRRRTEVAPGFPALLNAPAPSITPTPSTTGRRTALADWIARENNPLATRVIVNRIWQHHFGRGLVATANDFGTLGEPPSHPELLDWLTIRFIENGRTMKSMHRLIITSEAYRRTARIEPGERAAMLDPEDRLLWRFPPARLSAEQVRDAMLAVSGELHHCDGGPSKEGTEPVRSIYVRKKRNTPEEMLQCFDSPSGFDSAPERTETTTPTQALLLTNSEWPQARAQAFAKRVLNGRSEIDRRSVERAYQLAWGRAGDASEIDLALEFLERQRAGFKQVAPTEEAFKFPNETGLRPIAQNFAKVDSITLGDRALWLQPGSRFERLEIPFTKPSTDAFTIEAVVQLDAIQKDASVNTLISNWSGDHNEPGWTFGVTSERSRYQPRNLILQLIGPNPGGDIEYEVVASGLRVPLGRPVYVAVSVTTLPGGKGRAVFSLRDLSDANAPLQHAEISHNISDNVHNPAARTIVGGRDQTSNGYLWDGQVGRITLSEGTSKSSDPFSAPKALLDARFSGDNGIEPIAGSHWLRKPTATIRRDPTLDAMTDFCHALLTSNEFLYLH